VSYESLLLDHEIFSMLRRFQRGIEVTKEHLAVDVIEKIGTWGSFLAEEHTLRHFKKENWFPEISNRKLFEKWSEEGQKDAHRAAHKNVQGLLEKKRILSIDQITSGMLNRIIEEA
jgi:trimethylamine--corrinoid protein Co-methyltransferase